MPFSEGRSQALPPTMQPSLFEGLEPTADGRLRGLWSDLVNRQLPAAAKENAWPITENHCFARILLDNALSRPWREAVRPPAWRHTPLETLQRAIDLGQDLLRNPQEIDRLNARSLHLRRQRRSTEGEQFT